MLFSALNSYDILMIFSRFFLPWFEGGKAVLRMYLIITIIIPPFCISISWPYFFIMTGQLSRSINLKIRPFCSSFCNNIVLEVKVTSCYYIARIWYKLLLLVLSSEIIVILFSDIRDRRYYCIRMHKELLETYPLFGYCLTLR